MIVTLLIITLLIATLLFVIVAFDLYLHFKTIFFRIHIGRWSDSALWQQHITKVTYNWLKKIPTVKLTDSSRYVLLDIYKGKYKSKSIQSWQEGGLLLGALSANDLDGNNANIEKFISTKIDLQKGKWIQVPQYVDGVILGYAISKYFKDVDNIKPALDQTITLIENHLGKDGTVFYRDFIPHIRFVDTIGFICPFLTFYGVKYNKPEYVNLAFNQIDSYLKTAFLKDINLPAHAFDIENNVPLGIFGWGRGLGWFILGIVDMYNELPVDHEKKEFLKGTIIKTASDTLKFQKETGGFAATLPVQSMRHDSSITTLAGWLFYNAYLITNEATFLNAANKCVESLMKVTRRNGVIDFCQGDTKGIGVYAETFDLMPFVQGLTVRLVTEMKNKTK
jgi:unsaturated rhamnogalacturonyl hydrolase